MKKYKLVVAGGTFDRFHKGHKAFLEFLLSKSERALLGITSDEFVQKTKSDNIETYSVRKKAVLDLLSQQQFIKRVTIESINNIFIPGSWERLPVEAIVVTEETKSGAQEINRQRSRKGLHKLPTEISPFVLGEDGKPISSERIRSGEINREGRVWIRPSWFSYPLILPEELRGELKKPFGILYKSEKDLPLITGSKSITVGDIVTQSFNVLKVSQRISVVDFNVSRKKKFDTLQDLGFEPDVEGIRVTNPAGSLTPELFMAVSQLFDTSSNRRQVLVVNGEEDLAVLPFLLRAPLGCCIYYGQPGSGIVKIEVTEKSKEDGFSLLKKFISITRGY